MRPHVVAFLEGFMSREAALLLAPTWFTLVGLAGLATLLLMVRLARRHGIDPRVAASAVLWAYLAAVLAGILVPLAIDAVEQYVARGRVQVRWAGMTSFWGYLAGGVAVVVVCRGAGVPIGRLADLAAAPLGVALVLARMGCFLAGCDHGKVSALPWALRFPSGSPAWHAHVGSGLVPPDRAASLPVHPAQLYEAALGLVMVAVAIAVGRTRWARARGGAAFLAVAAAYAIGRLGIEELRGDHGRGFILGLASGQVFAIILLAAIATTAAVTSRLGRGLAPRAATVAATLLVVLASSRLASAQPATSPPAPTPPAAGTAPELAPAPVLAPAPDARPLEPYAADAPAPTTPVATTVRPAGRPRLQATALIGGATPVNRRTGQVAPLAGPSLSIGFDLAHGLGVWLDLDSMASDDAAHGTALVSGSLHRALRPRLELGARVGLGSTLVNFREPTFRDVAGPTLRVEALVTYDVGPRWFVAVRPLSFDVLTSDALGGPIITWQLRAGVGYRFGPRHRGTP